MNLDELRNYVRNQTQTTPGELENTTIDAYLMEGFNRTVAFENQWPWYEKTWELLQPAGATRIVLPGDVNTAALVGLMDARGARIDLRSHSTAEETWSSRSVVAGGGYVESSVWAGELYLWPVSPAGTDQLYALTGFRFPSDWMLGGPTAEPDIDPRLHRPLAHYAIALAYAQQEDDVLEQQYMQRWQRDVEQVRNAIMEPSQDRPMVMGPRHINPVGHTGASGPMSIAITPPGPQGEPGPAGPTGPAGPQGDGVPDGGTTGQVLSKLTDEDQDTLWVDPIGGGGGVPNTRRVDTTSPLTGGGALTADLSLAVSNFSTSGTGAGVVPGANGAGATAYLNGVGGWTTPTGGASNTATFSYNATLTEPPIGNQLRMNSLTHTSVTKVWVSQTTTDGLDVSVGLARILPGHQIYIQDRDNAAMWIKFDVTVTSDDGAYFDYTVVYNSGPGGFPAGQVEFQGLAPATSSLPPGGTTNQALTKKTATNYDVQWSDTVAKTAVYASVVHGATAGTARPTGYAGVIWYGSVQPTNAVAPDLVIRTDEAV